MIDPADPDNPTTIDLTGYPNSSVVVGPDGTAYQTASIAPHTTAGRTLWVISVAPATSEDAITA